MDVVPVPNFALGELPMALDWLITILRENEDFFSHLSAKAASGDNDFEDFGYRGRLARRNELRFHAIVGMNEYFNVLHDFTYF